MEPRRWAGQWWRPPPAEIALAVGFAALGVLLALGVVEGRGRWLAVALTVLHAGALAWRRREPEVVLGVQGATAVATVAAGLPPVVLGPALLVGVHGLGQVRGRDRALPVLAAVLLLMAVVVSVGGAEVDTVIGNAVALGIAWSLGERQRRVHLRAAEAEASAQAIAREAIVAERARIARELHDVVAHALSVVAVQAGTGRVVVHSNPTLAGEALANIERESRSALDEMRRLLEVLRDDGDGDGPLAPAPGLDDLDDLVERTERGGLPVRVHVDGDRADVPAGVELAAYRIVQEALTNVRRHAGATLAEVRVTRGPEAVDIEVVDDGRGTAGHAPAGGHGMVGMRERVALYGGWVETGDRAGGGFRVAAHIPCGGQS